MTRDELDARIHAALGEVCPRSLDHTAILERAGRRRRQRRGAAAALVVVLAAAITAVVLSEPSGGPLAPPTVQASAQIAVPGEVLGTAADGDYLWVLTCSAECGGPPMQKTAQGSLVKVDNSSGEIVATASVENPSVVAAGEGAVWVASMADGTVTRFDPRTAQATGQVTLSLPRRISPDAPEDEAFAFLPNAIAAGEGGVWVTTAREYVAEIDPNTLDVRRMISTPSGGGIATVGGSVWLSAGLFGLERIDPATGRLSEPRPIEDGAGRRLSLDYLVADNGSLWIRGGWGEPHGNGGYVASTDGDALALARLDPKTGAIDDIVGFEQPIWVKAISTSGLWLSGWESRAGSREVYLLEPGREEVILAARLAEPGTIVGAVGDSIWVARPEHVLQRYEIQRAD